MPPRPPRSAHTQKHTAPAHTLRTPVARLRTQKNTSPQTHTQVQKPQSITRPRAPRALLPMLIASICIAGVFAASPVFFPTNPPASLTPDDTTASGTLGYALSFFGSDGTAPNTEKLGGTPASEFLQVHPHCGAGEVWKGIDTSGKPLCGFVTTPLVMEMRLLSGSIRLNGTERKAPYSFSAQGTDRIETGKDRATLQFVADASLLRLDKQTSITLGYGANSDGQTVAQTVLERGVLWGRVLTGTGMNFGHWGFVAWVRGTGIKFGIREDGKLTVAVPHSRSQGFKTLPGMGDVTAALDMTCKNANGAPKSLGLLLGDERVYDTANCSEITPQKKSGIQTLYDTDRWIAENVIEDIMYINSILADAGAPPRHIDAAQSEKNITIPSTLAEKNALCAAGETYWEQFENSTSQKVCQSNRVIAAIEFTPSASTSGGGNAGGAGSAENAGVMQFKLGLDVPQNAPRKTIVRERYKHDDYGYDVIRDDRCFGGGGVCGNGWLDTENNWMITIDDALGRIHPLEDKTNPRKAKDLVDLLTQKQGTGWQEIYIPNASEWKKEREMNWDRWDYIKYPEGIFFQKERTFASTDIGTRGYYVTGNKVLIYKLDALKHERGLGGKQIEIEFADIQELLHTHSSTIAEFTDKSSWSSYSINFWYKKQWPAPEHVTTTNITCKRTPTSSWETCKNEISADIHNNTLSFTVPEGNYPTLYIGNNSFFFENSQKPIDAHIKSIRILTPQ